MKYTVRLATASVCLYSGAREVAISELSRPVEAAVEISVSTVVIIADYIFIFYLHHRIERC